MNITLFHPGVEMSGDPGFAERVRRLVKVSSVALGVIALLAWLTLDVPSLVMAALILGWVSMPSVLAASLHEPHHRFFLMVPGGLVSLALVAVSIFYLPSEAIGRIGWLLITGGVLLGGTLGMWFWYRMLPVPAALDDPFGRGRMTLIALHVLLVVSGMALVGVSSLV